MPKVGSRSFPYSPAGQQQAAAYAKSTGHPLSSSYKGGGKVKKAKGGRVKAMAGGMKKHTKKKYWFFLNFGLTFNINYKSYIKVWLLNNLNSIIQKKI